MAQNQNYKHTICCMGDSLTNNYTLGVPLYQAWPRILQNSLQAEGCKVVSRNFGHSGNTTTQMIARMSNMTLNEVPAIGIIFGGVNDPGNSITQATTQSNIQSMVSTLQSAGCNKIIVVSAHFLNYTTGGDYVGSTPDTDATCFYASVIAAQKAAVNAIASSTVVYCDLYNFLRNRIINGQDALASASWHVQPTNQHFNSYGWGLVASCVLATIQAQGWDTTLKS